MREIDPTVKVIVTSGFLPDTNLEYMKKAGHVGFIMKPFQAADLSKMLADVLRL